MAEVKARISVDAQDALKRIEEINRASGYASASMSKMAKEIGEANAALSSLGAQQGGTASATAFKNIAEQLERQALAYKLVDGESKAAASSATLYRNAILNLTKQGALTKEQTDLLVRTYNEYRTAAESAKAGAEGFAKAQTSVGDAAAKVGKTLKDGEKTTDSYGRKLLSIAGNILKFQLLMGPITAAIRGVKDTIADSVKVAAEAEQIFSKLSTVFTGLERSANSMAQSLSSSLGVAGSTAASALSTVGDLLQAQGMGTADSLATASSWISQFQDIIAFKDINMSLEEFAQNFMSGAAGNLRNFRTFGSIVKESAVQARLAAQGLDKLTGSQLELAKMTARAEMALEQQANAIGATEREWDTMLSVSRRLNEAWKEFKENLGDTLNRLLTPIKRELSNILSDYNKARSASKDVDSGSLSSSVYDIRNNGRDMNAFQKDLRLEFNTYERDFNRYAKGIIGADETLGFEALMYVVKMYGATVEDVIDTLGDDFPDAAEEYLKALDIDRIATMQMAQDIEDLNNEFASLEEAYGSFMESLGLLSGVGSIDTASRINTAQQLAVEVAKAGAQGFNNIKAADLSEFVSQVDLALGLVDEEGMIAAKAETIKSLYEILFNQFTKDKTLEKNADLLKLIADYYKEITADVPKATGAVASMQGIGASYDIQLAQLGMTDSQKAVDNLRREYETLRASALPEELDDLDAAFDDAEQTILAFFNAQERYNKALDDEAKEKERLAKYEEAVKSISESTADYAAQMAQVGMTDDEKALDDLRLAYERMRSELTLTEAEAEALDAEYGKQRQALTDLQARQKEYNDLLAAEAARLAAAEAAVTAMRNGQTAQGLMANYAMTTINPLQATGIYASADTWRAEQRASLRNTEAQLLALGVGASEVNAWIAEMIPLINEEYEAKKAEIDASIEAAEALKRLNAWQALGRKALGSMGTTGGVIATLTDENGGDIWTRILSALLDIMQKSEYWEDVVEILDMVVEPILPVVNMIAYTLKNLEPVFRLMAKFIGGVAMVVNGILAGVNYVIDFFQWLIAWIPPAFHNLGEVIAHPFNASRRDLEELPKLNDYFQETSDQYWKTFGEIKDSLEGIERNTADGDDYAKQLALLKNLYDNGVLTGEQYSGQIASVTGGSMGAVETYRGQSYATGSGGVTYYSGDIVINGYNKDPKELALEIERILQQRAQAGGNLLA